MVRLLVLSSWQVELYGRVGPVERPGHLGRCGQAGPGRLSPRPRAAVGAFRLGLGTEVSRESAPPGGLGRGPRPLVAELFDDDDLVETLAAQGIAALPSSLRDRRSTRRIDRVLEA